MSTDTLGAIFNSPARVRIMRLFLLNQKDIYASAHVAIRSNVSAVVARREVAILGRAGFIKRKKERKDGRMIDGWTFDPKFEYTESLKSLLFGTEFIDETALARRFKSAGRIKLLLLSGVFNDSHSSRLDLLLVGENLKRPVIDRIIRSLEAEIGKEISYAAFETAEFMYRASMYDKLIRDIIDFPHEMLINQGNILEQVPQTATV